MECTSLSSIFSLFWKNYLSVEFQNCDIDAGVKEKDKKELPFSLLKVLFSAWNLSAKCKTRKILMGEGNGVASVTLFTFTLKLGPHAHFYKEARPTRIPVCC